jgi:hypothetical protein
MAAARWTSYDASFPARWVEAMKRRSRAGGEPGKARRRKRVTLEHRKTPKAARRHIATAGGLETEVARLTHERDEALARQTATSEVLRVISQSPTDVRQVFDSIVLAAARLLRCDLVLVLLRDGATYSHAAVASPEGPFETTGQRFFRSIPAPIFPHARSSTKKCCTCRTGRASTCPNTN